MPQSNVSPFGLGNDETDVRQLFVPCYLVEHRNDQGRVQRLLFDAGLPPDIAGQGPVTPEAGMTLRYRRALADQLTDLDLTPADSPRQVLNGDHDVFGDDSVRLISAPGHTPGHQALLVRLTDPGPVVLSGDLYHFRASRRMRRVPVFNTDTAQNGSVATSPGRPFASNGSALTPPGASSMNCHTRSGTARHTSCSRPRTSWLGLRHWYRGLAPT